MWWKPLSKTRFEVALAGQRVLLRSATDRNVIPLRFTREEWADFLVAVKAGEFDLPPEGESGS